MFFKKTTKKILSFVMAATMVAGVGAMNFGARDGFGELKLVAGEREGGCVAGRIVVREVDGRERDQLGIHVVHGRGARFAREDERVAGGGGLGRGPVGRIGEVVGGGAASSPRERVAVCSEDDGGCEKCPGKVPAFTDD